MSQVFRLPAPGGEGEILFGAGQKDCTKAPGAAPGNAWIQHHASQRTGAAGALKNRIHGARALKSLPFLPGPEKGSFLPPLRMVFSPL
jgi:hypothetical protein